MKERVILCVDEKTAEFLGKEKNKSAFVREAIGEKMKSDNPERYSIIRCDRSGVFFGQVESLNGQTAKIKNARQIWRWEGACSVMQIAKDGISPTGSKVTVSADITVTDAIQVIPCSEKAEACIKGIKEWKI